MPANGGDRHNGKWSQFAELFATLWLASLVIGATVYMSSIDQISSDAASAILGSVLSLAGADMIRRRATRDANDHNGRG